MAVAVFGISVTLYIGLIIIMNIHKDSHKKRFFDD